MHYCEQPQPFRTPERPWGDPSVVVLGYYDGETDGILSCGICGQAYRFTLLDWDEQQDERVFALTRLSEPESRGIVDEVEKVYGKQSRRYWWPHDPTLSQEAKVAAWEKIQERFNASTKRPEAVLLTEHIDRDILALDLIGESDVIESVDWWSRLKPSAPQP